MGTVEAFAHTPFGGLHEKRQEYCPEDIYRYLVPHVRCFATRRGAELLGSVNAAHVLLSVSCLLRPHAGKRLVYYKRGTPSGLVGYIWGTPPLRPRRRLCSRHLLACQLIMPRLPAAQASVACGDHATTRAPGRCTYVASILHLCSIQRASWRSKLKACHLTRRWELGPGRSKPLLVRLNPAHVPRSRAPLRRPFQVRRKLSAGLALPTQATASCADTYRAESPPAMPNPQAAAAPGRSPRPDPSAESTPGIHSKNFSRFFSRFFSEF